MDTHTATQEVILAALIGAIVWNVLTWYFGIPSSSSHALIGGLVGATLVFAGVHAVLWNGVLSKVVLPMVISPLIGGVVRLRRSWRCIFGLFAHVRPTRVNRLFSWLQRLSAAGVAFNHGQNDAQKTMGVITLALVTFHVLPGGHKVTVPPWVMLSCATMMGLGTAVGRLADHQDAGPGHHSAGAGQRLRGGDGGERGAVRGQPAGDAGEHDAYRVSAASSASASPSASRMCAGRWRQRMVTAWVLTLPGAALVAGVCFFVIQMSTGSQAVALAH